MKNIKKDGILKDDDNELSEFKKTIKELWDNLNLKLYPFFKIEGLESTYTLHKIANVGEDDEKDLHEHYEVLKSKFNQCINYINELYGNSSETIKIEKQLTDCFNDFNISRNYDEVFENYEDAYKKLTGKDNFDPVFEDNVEEIYLDFSTEEPKIENNKNVESKLDSSITEMSIEELETLAKNNQQIIDKNNEDIKAKETKKAELIEKIKEQQQIIFEQNLILAKLAKIKIQNKEEIAIDGQ